MHDVSCHNKASKLIDFPVSKLLKCRVYSTYKGEGDHQRHKQGLRIGQESLIHDQHDKVQMILYIKEHMDHYIATM